MTDDRPLGFDLPPERDPLETLSQMTEGEWPYPIPELRRAVLRLHGLLVDYDRVNADLGPRIAALERFTRGDDAILADQEGVDIALADRLAQLEEALERRGDALEQMIELRTDVRAEGELHVHLPPHDLHAVIVALEQLGYPSPPEDPMPSTKVTVGPVTLTMGTGDGELRPRRPGETDAQFADRVREHVGSGLREALPDPPEPPPAPANIRDLTETHATRRLREVQSILSEAASSVRNENRAGASRGIERAQRIVRQVRNAMLRERPATEPGPSSPVAQNPGWHFPSGYGEDDDWLTDDVLRTIRDSVTEFSGGGPAHTYEAEQLANIRAALDEVLPEVATAPYRYLRAELHAIAHADSESDEWDAVEKYSAVRERARHALAADRHVLATADETEESGPLFDPDLVTVLQEAQGKARQAIDAIDRTARGVLSGYGVTAGYMRGTRDLIGRALELAERGATPHPQPVDWQAVREMVDGIRDALDPERTNWKLASTLRSIVAKWADGDTDPNAEDPAPIPTTNHPLITVPLGLAHAAAWMVEIPENTNPDLTRRIVSFRDAVTQGLRDAYTPDATATFMHPLNTPWTPDRSTDDLQPGGPSDASHPARGSGSAPESGPQDAIAGPLTPLETFPGAPVALSDLGAQIDRTEPGDLSATERRRLSQAATEAWAAEHGAVPVPPRRRQPSGTPESFEPLSVRRARETVEVWDASQQEEDVAAEDPLDVARARSIVESWDGAQVTHFAPPEDDSTAADDSTGDVVPAEARRPDEVGRSRLQIAVDALDLIRQDTEHAESEGRYANEVATDALTRLRAHDAPHPDEVDPLPPTGGPEGPGAPPEPGDPTHLPPADRIPLRADFRMREHVAASLWRVAVGTEPRAIPFDALPDADKEVWRLVALQAERELSSPDSARAREALVVLADAMRKIASQDFRGNMPGDVRAARAAIAEAQNAYNGVLPGNPTPWEAPF